MSGQAPSDFRGTSIFPTMGPFQLARWMRYQFAFLFVLGMVFWGAFAHQTEFLRYAYKMDFLGIYVGPRAVASGYGVRLYDLGIQTALAAEAIQPYRRSVMPFVYPAYVAVLLEALGKLGFTEATKVWLLFNLGLVFWGALRLGRCFVSGASDQAAIFVVFLAWTPVQLTLAQGQLGMLVTVGLIETLIALRAGREWAAGAWLALGLMKPQMILFPLFLFLIWRCWRVLAGFSVILAGVLGLSLVKIGFWIPRYWNFLKEYNYRGAELSLYPIAMQNWRGLACWSFSADGGTKVNILMGILTVLSVLAVVYMVVVRSGRDNRERLAPSAEAIFGITIILGLLSSPHLYMHDWAAALPGGFILWAQARQEYAQSANRWVSALLLWLLGLAPAVFFAKQFVVKEPLIPLFGAILVLAAILSLVSTRRSRITDQSRLAPTAV